MATADHKKISDLASKTNSLHPSDEYLLAFTGPPGAPQSASIRRRQEEEVKL